MNDQSEARSGSSVAEVTGDDALIVSAYRSTEHLIRALHARSGSVNDLVAAICDQAVEVIESAAAAAVSLASAPRRLTRVAATGAAPAELISLQSQMGGGPCLTAASEHTTIRVDDTTQEDRWPAWAAAAERLGVRSVLCLPLAADDRLHGTLSLYAEHPGAFDGDGDELTRQMLVALAGIALAQAQLVEQLREALHSRDTIGQAKGIVIARYGLQPDEAFNLLRQYSQDHNIKIVDLAQVLVEHGDFPGSTQTR